MSTTKEKILQQIADNAVILYMKGVPSAPECGFSAKTVGILNETKVPYAYVDVLKAPFIRDRLPSISKWPTFPQLFVNGELVGGCDTVESMNNDGSLLPLLQTTLKPAEAAQSDVIKHSEVEQMILSGYPDAKIYIEGEGCNLSISVVSDQFADLPMIKKHQGVMETLSAPLATGRLHAVTLKTHTSAEWQALQAPASAGLLQIQI